MKWRRFLVSTLTIYALCLTAVASTSKPDIVIYISDDHSQKDSGPYGNTVVRTPNLDRLAKDSLVFDRAFANSPSCTPSRCALFTGVDPMRNGAHANHSQVRDGLKTWPDHFHALGYRVVIAGKTDIRPDKSFPFEYFPAKVDPKAPPLTARLDTNAVNRILREHAAKHDKPLCLIVADWNPHVYWPENEGYGLAKVDLPPYFVDTPETRQARTRYYTGVSHMDRALGACMDSMEKFGYGDALFLYTSDQGAQWPHAKWTLYDAGIAVPFMIRWPGHVKPGRSSAMVQLTDVMPTFLEAAGGKAPSGIDGKSFLRLLSGKTDQHRDTIFAAHTADGRMNQFPCRSIRTAQYKYILNVDPDHPYTSHITSAESRDGRLYWDSWVRASKTNSFAAERIEADQHRPAEEFYDVQADPDELHNLATDPKYEPTLKSLRKQLADWRKTQGEENVEASAKASRPNIVLILADDLGFSDLGCYGSEISTPNLDKLAAHGLRFSQFYNTSRCCPTRASLLTGLYPHQAGIGHMMDDMHADGYHGELNKNCVTMAEVLRGAGYQTGMVGKWHVCHINFTGKPQLNFENNDPYWDDKHDWPLQRGFEKYFGTIHGVCSYYDPFSLVDGNTPVRAPATNFYYTDAISDHATDFISNFATNSNPFFLYVAYTAPHWPLQAPAEDVAKYRETYKVGWDEIRQRRQEKLIKLGLIDSRWPLSPRDPAVPRWEDAPNKDWEANRMAVYAAMVERMDRGVGKILAQLKQQRLDKNTVVIFLSDNGGCAENLQKNWYDVPTRMRDGREVRIGNARKDVLAGADDVWQSYGAPWANVSNTPFRLYKHWVHEGGIATPMIVSWPRHISKPGAITPTIGHVIDLMPTAMELGHAMYPLPEEGQRILTWAGMSLIPAITGQTSQFERTIFWEHEGNRAVRQHNWKLVAKNEKPWELYDVSADRTESKDVSSEFPDRVRALSGQYANWASATGVLPWKAVSQKVASKP